MRTGRDTARILLLEPVTPSIIGDEAIAFLRRFLDEGTQLDHVSLEDGPSSIETDQEVEEAIPGILHITKQSQNEYDAIVVACIGDAGVASARALSRIPVIGPGEAAMQAASMQSARFSVVVATSNGVTEMTRLANAVGLGERLASVRSLDIPITSFANDQSLVQAALVREARLAASADGADAVIIGCGLAAPVWKEAQRALAQTQPGVRLIEPLSWAVVLAESLTRVEHAEAHDNELARAVTPQL